MHRRHHFVFSLSFLSDRTLYSLICETTRIYRNAVLPFPLFLTFDPLNDPALLTCELQVAQTGRRLSTRPPPDFGTFLITLVYLNATLQRMRRHLNRDDDRFK
jgi:hypothetical protein